MRLGAWLRSGESIGWLATGTIQTLSIECPCSIFFWHVFMLLYVIVLFVILVLFVLDLFSVFRWSFVDVTLTFSSQLFHDYDSMTV